MLPDSTGDIIYSEVREMAPELPIVIVTGYPDSDMLDNILKHGPVTVLKKPLRVEQVSQTLRFLGHKIAEVSEAA
jgi:FixJ family two-component response regulator